MVQFTKLRLTGFKSFVDRTEMEIAPGLTGIVGPNGCGKSNLVEALKWSMGENSAKRMRGGTGSMEDVIFNGTSARPPRSFSEVTLVLDNTDGSAPAAYPGDEVEVTRRIERDKGSSYKINGKSLRARDIQLFYADIQCGAGSPFLISQGKVTTLITSKPHDRRMLLEEAAGITGLYARRHEAELRLRATENNLSRLEDIIGGMDARLQGLKKQSRQAAKYRSLSAQIRQMEVLISALDYRAAAEQLIEIEKLFGQHDSEVGEKMMLVSNLTKTHQTQSEDIPALRQKDAEIGAALQSQQIALQRLEDEEQRLTNAIADTKNQLDLIKADRSHETTTLNENTGIVERLDAEEQTILVDREQNDAVLVEKQDAQQSCQKSVSVLESELSTLTEQFAETRARKQSLEQQIAADRNRVQNVRERLARVEQALTEKQAAHRAEDRATPLRAALESLEKQAETLRNDLQTTETTLATTRGEQDAAREAMQIAQRERSRLQAEIDTLKTIVEAYAQGSFRPVLDDIRADDGFETALSKALGDTLMASLEDDAPVIWKNRSVDNLPALPVGVTALEPHIRAPQQLKLALSQIGVVDSDEQGNVASTQLKPGQALVSRDGAYWRWDGLYMKATSADRHAIQLKQKNKLEELTVQLPGVILGAENAQNVVTGLTGKIDSLQNQRRETQQTLQTTDNEIRTKRHELNRAIEEQSALQAEMAKLEEALSLARVEADELDGRVAESAREFDGFDEAAIAEQQTEIESLRTRLTEAREALHDSIRVLEIARQEESRRQARLQAIGDERVNLQNRNVRARERLSDLDVRETALVEKLDTLKKRPGEIQQAKESLLSRIGDIQAEKAIANDNLTLAETELGDTTKALKQAETELGEARERRAHAQATVAAKQQYIDMLKQQIRDQFDLTPEALLGDASADLENALPLDQLRHNREKSVRDRDMIGPVNLQADIEAEELEKELANILAERNDLGQAIDELRQGIHKLNKEARERLNTAFNLVNAHFQDMFKRLFNGGNAHLALIDSDDPLEAGLEIFAQPPGKALQSLSLLSGGEQTMTALALIFAMFLTNPAPICVMDEVDAPLDDANVDRVCDLLREFADKGDTRFILITHHRLTMARMDRLYGVTMAERGVSQLVSVDLNKQMDFLEDIAA
ncbi:MAG: chromosome segregation protein SMC [Micavibrio sp.]